MRKLLMISLLAASAFGQQSGSPPAAKILTRNELDTLISKPAEVVLIDVRRPDEIQTIGGFSAYLSIQAADLEKHLAAIPKDRTIVTISNHAARAGKAAQLLESKGFKVAGAIGAQTYEEEGGKLVKIAPPQQSGNQPKEEKR